MRCLERGKNGQEKRGMKKGMAKKRLLNNGGD